MEKKLFTIIIYTENIAGMLNQVTAEFTRRMMNIDTITASSSSIEGVHRYTISLWGEEDSVNKVTKRIEKKVDVLKADYYTDKEIFFQEVALYKLSTPKIMRTARFQESYATATRVSWRSIQTTLWSKSPVQPIQ